jgi:threonine dehydrogenase-like Zn-dependent dehydrogenase
MRVPYADVGPIKIPDGLSDEQVLFLSDIFPTGYMAADFCNFKGGETVAIWGCGPVGQFAIRSAFLLGAERVIAIDTVPERMALAKEAGAITIDFKKDDVYDRIQELTQGRGADACIDAVGTEADTGSGFDAVIDRVKVATLVVQKGGVSKAPVSSNGRFCKAAVHGDRCRMSENAVSSIADEKMAKIESVR